MGTRSLSLTEQRAEASPSPNLASIAGLSSPALFAFETHVLAGETVIMLCGELDSWTQRSLVTALAGVPDNATRIVLDMTDLAFIDAGNIGLIHRSRILAGLRGAELVVRSPIPHVEKILRLTDVLPREIP